jgi:serine/threonine-protein kinase
MSGELSYDHKKECPKCRRRYPDYATFCSDDAQTLIDVIAEPQAPSPATGRTVVAASASPQGISDNLVGRVIDNKYKVESMVGEGGMAIVYLATQLQMDRPVVIKVMQGWLLSNKNSAERFERECKWTAKLNHPNIVAVYDVGAISEMQPYLVMEYIKGEALADKLSRQGALPLTTVGNIMVQICRGLQEAHSIGIIHRDLKPENILLQERSDRPDWVKIVDFGISHAVEGSKRLTKTGKMIGTPEYIAPEQLRDRALDVRSDIYAAGVMMYEMITGRVPFDGESVEAVLMKHLMDDPAPISTLRDDVADDSLFSQITMRALKKDPDDRYQTITELRLDIEQALSNTMLKRGG